MARRKLVPMLAPTAMPICDVWERVVDDGVEEGEVIVALVDGEEEAMAPACDEVDEPARGV
jgi:hypothetical protein